MAKLIEENSNKREPRAWNMRTERESKYSI